MSVFSHPKFREYFKKTLDINEYFRTEIDRIRSGDLNIYLCEETWPANFYTDPHVNVNLPLVFDIAQKHSDIKEFRCTYDRNEDFHHIRFKMNGIDYDIRWYKIYVLTRCSDKKEFIFGYNPSDIPSWLIKEKKKQQ